MEIISITKEIDGLRQMADQLRDQKLHQKEHVAGLERQQRIICGGGNREKIAQAEQRRKDYAAQAPPRWARRSSRRRRRATPAGEDHRPAPTKKEITARRETAGRELARLEEEGVAPAEYDGIISRLWDEYGSPTQASRSRGRWRTPGRRSGDSGSSGEDPGARQRQRWRDRNTKRCRSGTALRTRRTTRRSPRRAHEADHPAHERHAVDLRG
ncbi:MAG: hypothetical protein ACLVL7_08455 [Anaerotruncus massiliensis (ex Togo et al. 2019)]